MSFMDSLSSNPSGSGIYGQQSRMTDDNMLGLLHQVRDRDIKDFKDKASFMSDLSLKQDRMRALFNPNKQEDQKPQMNTVMAQDPNQLTGYQKAEIGLKKEDLNLNKTRLAQQGKLGQGALDIRDAQQQLNQQKSDQIHNQKQEDMQRKIDDSTKKFELAKAELDRKTQAGEDTIQARKNIADAIEERHRLEMAQKDTQFLDTKKLHEAQIKKMEEDAKNATGSETTTEINADGTKKVVSVKRGSIQRIGVIGPNGEKGTMDSSDTLPSGWKKK